MDLAIKLAKEHGVGWVVAKNSNHFGIAGYYALQAASHGLVVRKFGAGGILGFRSRNFFRKSLYDVYDYYVLDLKNLQKLQCFA